MIEVYETRVHLTLRSKRISQRYFWIADNPTATHPWIVSSQINDRIVTGSFWFDFLTLIVSEHASFRRVTTRRTGPSTSAASHFVLPGGGVLGQWPFDCSAMYTAVRVQWIADNDAFGKYANRIGPIGAGAADNTSWNPLFLTAVNAWASQHGIIYATPSGVTFQGATVDHLGIANPVTGVQITWPPATQANRRLRV